ncbi:beta- -glucosidase [Colletotrichum incanum]|uniref:Beta--glucosidase n=1 Tax=Colletotrichum incanum TaxID=1573173 RepID=A0A166RQE0_COLIC|nr:beta- -glucosidase [Colletotrichum incanum]
MVIQWWEDRCSRSFLANHHSPHPLVTFYCPPPTDWPRLPTAAAIAAMEYRPKDVHTKHLTETDRIRIRTLYFDAHMPQKAITKTTGYTINQVRYAIRADSAAIKPRSGRPRRLDKDQKKHVLK